MTTKDVTSLGEALVNPRYVTGILDEPKQLLRPITGYTNEPLLPLEEACAPLDGIVSHLNAHVWIAKRNCSNPPDGLTQNESAAIHLYTMEWAGDGMSLYSLLNSTLKTADRRQLRPWFKYLKLFLTALAKLPFAPQQVVWRGVQKNISAEFEPGTEVTWWAFSSCTSSLSVLESNLYLGCVGERTLFSIEALNGKMIRAHSHFDVEDEILLMPGTFMEVQSRLNPAPDLTIIHLKQKVPPEMLLESPFPGALLYPSGSTSTTYYVQKKQPWYKRKTFVVGISCLIVLALLAIILGSVLGTRSSASINNQPSINNQTSSNNQDTCKPRQLIGLSADVLWSFDCLNANNDRSNNSLYNGIGVNNPSYVTPDYSGQGAALSLDKYNQQYINIPQYINYTLDSLSVSAWIYPSPLPGQVLLETILGQCNQPNSSLGCLVCEVRSDRLVGELQMYFQLGNNVVRGSTVLSTLQWQHVAFVFDIATMTQLVYLNGQLDGNGQAVGPINSIDLGTTPTIGTNTKTSSNYYSGLIDQLAFSFRAKSDSEVLDEATLLVHYQFNSSVQLYNDSGPNGIPGQGVNTTFDAASSSLLFNLSSYYRSSGLFLPSNNGVYSYSFACWLKFLWSMDGTYVPVPLVRLSVVTTSTDSTSGQTTQTSESCLTMLYYQANAFLMSQYPSGGIYYTNNNIRGTNLYHVAITLNGSNGDLLLYVNGTRVASSNASSISSLMSTGSRLALTLGHSFESNVLMDLCNVYVAATPWLHFVDFIGLMGDVRFYSRVLTDDEIRSFASITL